MDQHKLYRTIKLLGEEKFRTEEQMLVHVLENIIANEEIPIKGGRIWKLEPATGNYRLIHQYGEMDPIRKNFRIHVSSYPVFRALHRTGTMVGSETNRYLRKKGIRHYSATGVGEKVQWKGYTLFPYVIAVNGEFLGQDFVYTLNIIGNALTSALVNQRTARKAKLLERDLDQARAIQQVFDAAAEVPIRFHGVARLVVEIREEVLPHLEPIAGRLADELVAVVWLESRHAPPREREMVGTVVHAALGLRVGLEPASLLGCRLAGDVVEVRGAEADDRDGLPGAGDLLLDDRSLRRAPRRDRHERGGRHRPEPLEEAPPRQRAVPAFHDVPPSAACAASASCRRPSRNASQAHPAATGTVTSAIAPRESPSARRPA